MKANECLTMIDKIYNDQTQSLDAHLQDCVEAFAELEDISPAESRRICVQLLQGRSDDL